VNGLAIAQEVAKELDLSLNDELLEWLMWNETGWPSFFDGDPETVYRRQIRSALKGDYIDRMNFV
jgi:hypothetical protein